MPDTLVPPKPFFWSWSRLQSFETCAKQFYHVDVAKDVAKNVNLQQNWGLEVHKALADRIMHAKPLPMGMEQYEYWVERICKGWNRLEGPIISCEKKFAITADYQPCEYFDRKKQVWLRVVADVLKQHDDIALIVDWKTGKRKDDLDQLQVSAAVVFAHFPNLQKIRSDFVWLQEPPGDNALTTAYVHRSDLARLWQRLLPRVGRMQKALNDLEFAPNPSGLCKKHCNVISCPYHGRGSQ
jgi:hypothetical protein